MFIVSYKFALAFTNTLTILEGGGWRASVCVGMGGWRWSGGEVSIRPIHTDINIHLIQAD